MGMLRIVRSAVMVMLVIVSANTFAQKSAAPTAKSEEGATTGVVWKKQIARVIDMGEKSGSSSKTISDVSSENTMMDMFINLIKNNKIIAYANTDHNFTTRLTVGELNKMLLMRRDTVLTTDPKTGKTVSKINNKDINVDSVHKFRILEEWTCYPATGKSEIQIIGLAPLKDDYNEDGTFKSLHPMFWLKFSDISAILARYQQYHPNNTLAGRIWDDYFIAQGAQK